MYTDILLYASFLGVSLILRCVVRFLLICSVFSSAPSASFAASGEAPAAVGDVDPEVKALYQQGRSAFDLGHIREALGFFEQAYKKQNIPIVLYNIAQCHRRLGDLEAAKLTYESYLLRDPKGVAAKMAVDNLKEVNAALSAQSRAQNAKPNALPVNDLGKASAGSAAALPPPPASSMTQPLAPAAEPAPGPILVTVTPPAQLAQEPKGADESAAAAGKAEKKVAAVSKPSPAPKGAVDSAKPAPAAGDGGEHGGPLRYIAAGVAVAAAAGGTFFYLGAKSDADAIANTPHSRAETLSLGDSVRSKSTNEKILYVSAAALGALSVAFFVLNF